MSAGGGRGVAVVTGATGGVGRALVRELADRGWDVGLVARGAAGLQAALADVEQRGRRGLAVSTDVADHEAVEEAARRIEAALGEIDLWVNNAMTTVFAPVAETQPAEIERATKATFLGQVYVAMSAMSRMRERDRGTIVFVGPALSYRAYRSRRRTVRRSSRSGGFYESLRTELLYDGSKVRVTTVHLPAVNTTQFGWCRTELEKHPQPVPPIYQPEVAARAIADAAEHPPRQKILGTWNWLIVQLAQVMPGVGDHFMAQSGVSGQLTDISIDPERPGNLFTPVDDDIDHGSHGIFDDRSEGVRTPSFLGQVPGQVRTLATAVTARLREVRARRRSCARSA